MDLGYDGELAAHVVGLRAPTEKEYVDYLRQRGVAEGHLVSPATYAQTYMRSRLQAVGRDVGPVRDDGLWDPRPMFEQIDSRDVRDIADSIAHAVRDELFKADAREPDVRRAEREPDMRPSERRPRGGLVGAPLRPLGWPRAYTADMMKLRVPTGDSLRTPDLPSARTAGVRAGRPGGRNPENPGRTEGAVRPAGRCRGSVQVAELWARFAQGAGGRRARRPAVEARTLGFDDRCAHRRSGPAQLHLVRRRAAHGGPRARARCRSPGRRSGGCAHGLPAAGRRTAARCDRSAGHSGADPQRRGGRHALRSFRGEGRRDGPQDRAGQSQGRRRGAQGRRGASDGRGVRGAGTGSDEAPAPPGVPGAGAGPPADR